MKNSLIAVFLGLVATGLLVGTTDVFAYQFWSDATNSTGQCAGCHSGFRENNDYFSSQENSAWGMSLHDAHLENTDITGGTNGSCGNCHDGEGTSGNRVRLNRSANAKDGVNAIACMGCHGRLEDANEVTFFGEGWGAGLRQHHENSIAANGACVGCHADSNPGAFTTAAENVAPPWYSAVNNTNLEPDALMDACSANNEEDFSGDGGGTDNDGDHDYDLADADCTPTVPTPGDFDFDGQADILWRHAITGQVYFWQMNGPEILSSASVATPASDWLIVGTGDYNGDDSADILWRNSATRQIYYWQMDGSTIVAADGVATPSSDNWRVIGSGDYDGDGNADIMWRHIGPGGTGQIFFWQMSGSSVSSAAPVATLSDLQWQAVGSGDYDGDGNDDLMWRHEGTGQVYYWRMNGAMIMSSAAVARPPDLNWGVVGNGDYDGDGNDDLMWRHATSGKVYYWQMNGGNIMSSSRVSIVSDLAWSVAGDGDYNGDGSADILWLHTGNGQVFYWQQDGANTVDPSPVSTLGDLNWGIVYEE